MGRDILPMPEGSSQRKDVLGVEPNMAPTDDLLRDIYLVLGAPIDCSDMATVMQRVDAAAQRRAPFLVSTVNINFLAASRTNAEFQESLYRSDLCTVDGMPVKWIARLLGIPVKERTAGTDALEAMKLVRAPARALKVFLFGGKDGAAACAGERLNAERTGLICVGSCYPGFGTVDEMSSEAIINRINASGADVLLLALGAVKGQVWLLRNHARLRVPVRAHFGTAINVQAGMLRRAPEWMQKTGLEWLWRIKEEPQLWRRYAYDGLALLRMLPTRILPLILLTRWQAWRSEGQKVAVTRNEDDRTVTIKVKGPATGRTIEVPLSHVQYAAESGKDVAINFSQTSHVDARFLGLLLMLEKTLNAQRRQLTFTGISGGVERMFRLNGFRPLRTH